MARGWLPVFIGTQPHSLVYALFGCFWAPAAELSSCDRLYGPLQKKFASLYFIHSLLFEFVAGSYYLCNDKKCHFSGFPGGAVVKNPPANAGDTGSSPGPGKSHMRGATKPMPHNYWACALEPVSHNYWVHVLQLLKPACLEPVLCNKRSHRDEKPTHHNEE